MMRSTTVLAVRRGDQVVICGDGQVTLGDTVMKHEASKVRRLRGGAVLVGFAGAADVERSDDIGVIELGCGFALGVKSFDEAFIVGELFGQDFDRHQPVEA